MHAVLASEPDDPAFSPEVASQESLALLSATVDDEIDNVFLSLPDNEATAPIQGRGDAMRGAAARPLDRRLGRPADPPSRRPAPRADAVGELGAGSAVGQTDGARPRIWSAFDAPGGLGRDRLRGRAGPPAAGAAAQALAAARRRRDAALVHLRGARGRCRRRQRRAARPRRVPRRVHAGRCRRRRSCRRARRPSDCCGSSSSRRRSTSCGTSWPIARTGYRFPVGGIVRLLEQAGT